MPQVSDTTSKTHPKPWHFLHVVYVYKQVTTQRNVFITVNSETLS